MPLPRLDSLRARHRSPDSLHGMGLGAALVLVALPGLALVTGVRTFAELPSVGLPILAIFGIVILLGALAVTSALFARLGLATCSEALGLPPGSIRAAIALSLIVLFALISVMLYQSLNGSRNLENVSAADKDRFLADPLMNITAVTPVPCKQVVAAAAPEGDKSVHRDEECTGYRYTLRVDTPPSAASVDLAKQLLTLIGTLMTSVVSYYFAAKTSESAARAMAQATTQMVTGGSQDGREGREGQEDQEDQKGQGASEPPVSDVPLGRTL